MLRGTSMAHQGHPAEGIAEVTAGLAELENTGTELAAPYFRARLAEAYLLGGKRQEGLEIIDASLRTVDQAWWRPEQLRIRAELLLLGPGAEAEAEATLRQALDTARSQGSKVLELRAAASLARLLQRQGRAAEGQALLSERYGSFTEGLDTPDLRDVRDLRGVGLEVAA